MGVRVRGAGNYACGWAYDVSARCCWCARQLNNKAGFSGWRSRMRGLGVECCDETKPKRRIDGVGTDTVAREAGDGAASTKKRVALAGLR